MRQDTVKSSFSLREDYWENFELKEDDLEFLYNHLLETEIPITPNELVELLVGERIRKEKHEIERKRSSGGDTYMPKEHYKKAQKLVFPQLAWKPAEVVDVRPGHNPDLGSFEVIQVVFKDGEIREYAAGLEDHKLNEPPELVEEDDNLNPDFILENYREDLVATLEANLEAHGDFVRIAGRWFPRALLVDINIGHLNLAEAVLDMAGGGPLPTSALMEQLELPENVNPRLLEFSMDLSLQEDGRFDEVGASGEVSWFLQRLEPEEVLEPPIYLRYAGMDYERPEMTEEMLALEQELDDELSPLAARYQHLDEVEVRLIYPHWRAGTLPLSVHVRHLFPTAYESPRIRFTLIDGETGDEIPAWVVRAKRYVYGLTEWYEKCGFIPGSIIRVERGPKPGQVVVHSDRRRSSREWIRTVLVGSDGGVVYAMLKQIVQSNFDERMAIAVPDVSGIDMIWERMSKEKPPFERVVVNTVRELAKLNPQGHVHASELYAALNIVRRCPPGPMLALLASRPWFSHVGDLHFRYTEA